MLIVTVRPLLIRNVRIIQPELTLLPKVLPKTHLRQLPLSAQMVIQFWQAVLHTPL